MELVLNHEQSGETRIYASTSLKKGKEISSLYFNLLFFCVLTNVSESSPANAVSVYFLLWRFFGDPLISAFEHDEVEKYEVSIKMRLK